MLDSGQNRRFFSLVILQFDGWHCKTIGYFFYATSNFVHHFIASEFKLKLQSGNAQIGEAFFFTSVALTFDLWSWPVTWTRLFVSGNNWKFHDDTMTGTSWTKSVRRTNKRKDGWTDVLKELLGRSWNTCICFLPEASFGLRVLSLPACVCVRLSVCASVRVSVNRLN